MQLKLKIFDEVIKYYRWISGFHSAKSTKEQEFSLHYLVEK